MLPPRSSIILCDDIEESSQFISGLIPKQNRVVSFVKEKFLVEDAKAVIAEAYVSEIDTKYILIGAKEYNIYSQNALLKILEEPPKNIIFYLFSQTKSSFLPTIRSRLALVNQKKKKQKVTIELDMKRLDLEKIYSFIQQYKDQPKQDAKAILEALMQKAVDDGIALSKEQLENFDTAYRLLELNSRFSSVLSLVLMGIFHENKNTIN